MWKPRSSGDELVVGILHWSLPPTIGGVESHLADYIRLLHAQGVKVVAFTGVSKVQEIQKYAAVERHPLLDLAGGGKPAPDGAECVAKLSSWLEEKVLKYGVNVIHGHNLHYFSSAPVMAVNEVCERHRIARQHTFHNYWKDAGHADLLANWEGRWANSSFVARQCAGSYQGAAPQPRYMGIDTNRFNYKRAPFDGRNPRSNDPRTAPVILQPARLLRWKGPEYSVRMLSELRRSGYSARLVLTDTPSLIDWDDERKELRTELEQLIVDLDLKRWVKFRNRAFYRDMPRLYNEADIVINPSRREPWGLVPLEAMAASRPVVATDSGGVRESITHRTGTLVTDNSNIVAHLVKAVKAFLDRPDKAVQAGRLGREHVVRKFHMDTYVQDMLLEYRTALKEMQYKNPTPAGQGYEGVPAKQPDSLPVGA